MKRKATLVFILLTALIGLTATSAARPQSSGRDHSFSVSRSAGNPRESAVIPIKYADVREVAKVFETFRAELGGVVKANPSLRVVAVSGSKALVDACKEAARKLDVPYSPRPEILLTYYVLSASPRPTTTNDIPQNLTGVVTQMRKLAALKSFHLLDTQTIRVAEGGQAKVQGSLPAFDGEGVKVPTYEITFEEATLSPTKNGVRIKLKNLELTARVERRTKTSAKLASIQMRTDVDFSEGQKTVIGTSGIPGTKDALLLVVTAQPAG